MTPTIVAELSCNHLGGIDRALELILAARYAGATACKFQCWSPELMVGGDYVVQGNMDLNAPQSPWTGQSLNGLYAVAHSPWDWFPKLFACARELEMEAFASVFDYKALAYMESLGCPRYKIASFEITDLPLIRAVARTGKPIIISTGMASEEEIFVAERTAVDACHGISCTLLQCTSAYPAAVGDANLSTMDQLSNFASGFGVSDHTIGTTVPVVATVLGATMIEKHLTLRRSDGGPDAAFSSEPNEFAEMVRAVTLAASSLGEVRYGPTESEKPQLQFRRSLWWAKDIEEGETIFEQHIQSSRPAMGIEPRFIDDLIGKPAKLAAKAGDPVTKEFL